MQIRVRLTTFLLIVASSLVVCPPAYGQDKPAAPLAGGEDAAELAKKLSNPVAAMISVPFQNNFEFGIGPED